MSSWKFLILLLFSKEISSVLWTGQTQSFIPKDTDHDSPEQVVCNVVIIFTLETGGFRGTIMSRSMDTS